MVILDWLQQHREILGWLGAVSLVTFFATIAAVPLFLVSLPQEYLSGDAPPRSAAWAAPLRGIYRIGKNVFGGLLLLAGVALLVLPGQGLLTIFVGLVLTDVPGKRPMLRRIIGRRSILDRVNRLREKTGRPPLLPP